jgi:hypothetical protein
MKPLLLTEVCIGIFLFVSLFAYACLGTSTTWRLEGRSVLFVSSSFLVSSTL